ncbi:hypothetical protein HK099_008169 [Clydaea vesicula]|uniref:CTLH domain-containing protein n=1 Tax=Clydaea vesicula TaxID=447962 RepID=A0AAD5U524_9FUNG|nr:hypothetical protein HK099_008169 [Clydaea vesicula]
MDTVLIDFEKAVKRQKLSSEFSQFQIDKIIEQLKADKNNLKTLKELTSSLIDSQKDLYTVFGKFVKNLEKQKLFKNDLNSQVWDPKAFENKEEVLLQTLATHFIREGRFKSYNKFVQESNLSSKNSLKDSFVDMYQILEAMKEKNLLPAIEWAKKNKSLLESKGSTLEFDLHRCKFIQLVVDNKSQEALSYAREFISPFHNSHPKGDWKICFFENLNCYFTL